MKVPLLGCGALSFAWGAFFSCVGVGMIVSPTDGAERLDGVFAGGLFGGLPMIFGTVLLVVGIVLHVRERREARALTWLRTRDRFTVDEFAQAHGLGPAAAETRLYALLGLPRSPPFVFHRSRREYLRRGALTSGGRTVERCPACGARVGMLLLTGESGDCPQCGSPI
jgi:hypothetical protein